MRFQVGSKGVRKSRQTSLGLVRILLCRLERPRRWIWVLLLVSLKMRQFISTVSPWLNGPHAEPKSTLTQHSSQEELREMITRADSNHDGKVSMDDFYALMVHRSFP